MANDAESIRKHIKSYMMVGGALAVLTFITVAVSFIHFGAEDSDTGNIVVALIIATIKAGLVALIFMHLSAEKKEVYRIIALAVFMAVALYALTEWHFQDPIKFQNQTKMEVPW